MSSDAAKLVRAAGAGDDAVVKRLLKAKADVDVACVNDTGDFGTITALQAACATGQVRTARLLIKAKANVDLRNSRGACALGMAAYAGQLACAQLLIEAKAMIELPDSVGCTALIASAEHAHGRGAPRAQGRRVAATQSRRRRHRDVGQ
jgi:ankyrin repeat protein